MPKATFYFTSGASTSVEVEFDKDSIDLEGMTDDLLDKAYDALDTTLCHHCAGHIDVGDFEWDGQDPVIRA